MRESTRVAVIGAGLSGLTAAYRLQRAGADVVVLEAQERVGGRLRTDRLQGFQVDAGAQLFGSMYTNLLGLADEVGLRDRLVHSPGRDALWRGGRAHEVTYGSVASMLVSSGLGMVTKMRLGATYLPFLTRYGAALQLHAPQRAAAAGLDAESIAAWGERELGSEFVESLAYPQLAAYFGSLPEETSAGFYHMLARHAVDVSVYAFRGGSAVLCEALAERVVAGGGEVRLGAAVVRVESEGTGARVVGQGGEERFVGAVLAVPAPLARDLLGGEAPGLREWLQGVRFRPALTVGLLLDRPVGVRYFGLSFRRDGANSTAAVCVQENKGAELVPPGRGLLVAIARPEAAVALLDAEPRRVVDALLPDVEQAFPSVSRHVERARVYRWPEGYPVVYPGYLRHLGRFGQGEMEGGGALVLAGDYLFGASAEAAVLSGAAAADRLARRLDLDPAARPAI